MQFVQPCPILELVMMKMQLLCVCERPFSYFCHDQMCTRFKVDGAQSWESAI